MARDVRPRAEGAPSASGAPPAGEDTPPAARAAIPPGPIAAAPRTSPSGAISFVVWPHGAVQHNGRVFMPGEPLPISEAEAARLGGAAVKV